jgi:SOS-response transcriptional repressor LexA
MSASSPIYRDLMRFKPDGVTPNGWAVKAGISRTVWADMRRHGNPSRKTLEKLLAVAGSSVAEFEALRIGDDMPVSATAGFRDPGVRAWGAASLPPLPLVVSTLAGDWNGQLELTEIRTDQLVQRLPRPVALAGDPEAYAVTIVGDSMWPRFRPGRRVAVSPRSPVALGDDVLVALRAEPGSGCLVLIKELVRRTSGFIELRQFNPDVSVAVENDQVESIYKVVGELI